MVRTSTHGTPTPGTSQTNVLTKPRSSWAAARVLVPLVLALVLASLDQTAPAIALPQIVNDLHHIDSATWVVTSYLLAQMPMIPIAGFLAGRIGRKRCLVAGMVLFLAGSLLAGAAPTMNQLILFRGLQGIGSGCLFAAAFALPGAAFSNSARLRWQTAFIGVFALCSAGGPTVGLWLLNDASWRWIFYTNLPFGIVVLVFSLLWYPPDQRRFGWKRSA